MHEASADLQRLREQERRNYPCPAWLTTRGCINVAVTGNAGVGKSSFINTLRGLRARDPGAPLHHGCPSLNRQDHHDNSAHTVVHSIQT
eukprot:3864769-Amphidinium_carterae.1